MKLEPCLINPSGSTTDPLSRNSQQLSCSQFQGEVYDMLAYRRYVSSAWAGGSASPVLVAFHNLVTSSVPEKYLYGSPRVYFCAQQVQESLRSFVGDVGAPAPPTPVQGVLGLDTQHRLLAC